MAYVTRCGVPVVNIKKITWNFGQWFTAITEKNGPIP